jgi:hypothetical protein
MSKITGKSCEGCGYDLTGLEMQGTCPECGRYRDAWSGEGLAGGVMDKHRRGDWVVRLFQTLGLLFLGVVILGIGALLSWKSGHYKPLIPTAAISSLCLVSAVFTGLSLRRL